MTNKPFITLICGGFFVGPFMPFIGNYRPPIKPFVGKNIPFDQSSPKTASGFTLIELVITLVVAAILVTVAVPNMRDFIHRNRIVAQNNDFISDTNTARSEAIKRGVNVVICTSSTGTACNGGTNWAVGRLIFADTNSNATYNAGEELRYREAIAGGNTFTSAGGNSAITIDRRGIPIAGATAYTLCDSPNKKYPKILTLGPTGSVTTSSTTAASCP